MGKELVNDSDNCSYCNGTGNVDMWIQGGKAKLRKPYKNFKEDTEVTIVKIGYKTVTLDVLDSRHKPFQVDKSYLKPLDNTDISCKLCDATGINKKNPHKKEVLEQYIATEDYVRVTPAAMIVKDTMTRVQYKRKDAKVGEKNAYYQALVEIAEKQKPQIATKASELQLNSLATPGKSLDLKTRHYLQKKLTSKRIDE